MRNRKNPLLLTSLCTVLILCIGYMGIVKGGNCLLNSKEEPEKVTFENTGSNVFYGKIEDIQLFPWNYYGKNVCEQVGEQVEDSFYDLDIWEETFHDMLAYNCEVPREYIDSIYRQKGKGIMYSLEEYKEEGVYFYQDILEVESKKFQVKIAFSQWNILNFSCIEYRENDVREDGKWIAGKEVLTKMLAQHPNEIREQFLYMGEMCYKIPPMDSQWGKWYMSYAMIYSNSVAEMNMMLGESSVYRTIVKQESLKSSVDNKEEYSYQVIELNDMILLLVQGNVTMGFFYDPISQVFCGYNFF